MQERKRLLVALLVASVTAVALGGPGLVHAQATIVIDVLDGPGEGFNDPGAPDSASAAGGNAGATLGDQRFVAFAYAADIWAGVLDSSQAIVVGATFDHLLCEASTASLGAAGTNTVHRDFTGAPVSNTWYPAALANALAGADLAPGNDDIDAFFNSAVDDAACAFPKIRMVHLLVAEDNFRPGSRCFIFRWRKRRELFHCHNNRLTQQRPIEQLAVSSYRLLMTTSAAAIWMST